MCSNGETYISDRKSGLASALTKVYPYVHLGACCTHLVKNFKDSKLSFTKDAINTWQKIKHPRRECDVETHLKSFQQQVSQEAYNYILDSMWAGDVTNKEH